MTYLRGLFGSIRTLMSLLWMYFSGLNQMALLLKVNILFWAGSCHCEKIR